MKLKLILIIFIITSGTCRGQTKNDSISSLPMNSLYLEFLGNSLFYGSVNYDRIILGKGNCYLSSRIGLGAFYSDFYDKFLSVPILLNFIYHVYKAVSIETGLGTTLFFVHYAKYDLEKTTRFFPLIVGFIGIRITTKNGFNFRTGFTPFGDKKNLGDHVNQQQVIPWFGFSFGYSFGKKKR